MRTDSDYRIIKAKDIAEAREIVDAQEDGCRIMMPLDGIWMNLTDAKEAAANGDLDIAEEILQENGDSTEIEIAVMDPRV